MFAGHVEAALAIGRARPEINVGVFVFAALLLDVLVMLLFAFTVAGMTVAPPPPSVQAMDGATLATLGVVCALAFWLGRRA